MCNVTSAVPRMRRLRNVPSAVLTCALLAAWGTGTGCSSNKDRSFSYRQAPNFVRDMRGEHIAAYDSMGKAAGLGEHHAERWHIDVGYCDATGRSGSLGDYSCNADCMGVPVCAHATAGLAGPWTAKHTYAGPSPHADTIIHECLHPFLQQVADNPAELAANNGHPETVTIHGVVYRVRSLMYRQVRWPMAIWEVPIDWAGDMIPWTSGEWAQGCNNGILEPGTE